MIYFDNSATTRLDDRVRSAMEPYLGPKFGNASSIHALGREARVALETARSEVARCVGADPAEIVFTSGGTESDNHAVCGSVFAAHLGGRSFADLSVLTSPLEHQAILSAVEFVGRLGVRTHLTGVTHDGLAVVDNIPTDLTLTSVMHVNNEVGSVNDIRSIVASIRVASPTALIHTDAVQALGKLRFDVHELGVDLMTLSAHKIHGPKGIGALYIRRGVQIEPLVHGGSQERNRRGGTEAVALAVGFAEAARLAHDEFDDRTSHIRALRSQLLDGLRAMPEVVLNSPDDDRCVPTIVNLTLRDDLLRRLEPETLIVRLDLDGIAVSNGAACTSGSLQPSHVLRAMGRSEEVATKSIRLSLSKDNTPSDIEAFIRSLKAIVHSA
ncbi:MAG: cysteine desulfurase [Bacteroidetes bacterium]|nr:cysteine desulfurase [Bacteroidota bacterium]